jgi:hypothetical protein
MDVYNNCAPDSEKKIKDGRENRSGEDVVRQKRRGARVAAPSLVKSGGAGRIQTTGTRVLR